MRENVGKKLINCLKIKNLSSARHRSVSDDGEEHTRAWLAEDKHLFYLKKSHIFTLTLVIIDYYLEDGLMTQGPPCKHRKRIPHLSL